MTAGRVPTMTDVARRAGVTQATVSYVLNNVTKHTISDDTRQAVLKAARELGYRPNHNARSLASGQSSVVVVVVPPLPLSEPVLALLGELTTAFAREGHVLTVHFEASGEAPLTVLRDALKPRAVFALFPSDRDDVPSFAGLMDDYRDPGACLQVDYLSERGHRQLAFAGSAQPELERQSGVRQRSMERRAYELGLPDVLAGPVRSDGSDAASVVKAWYGAGVTAVCANNDEVALAVLRGIRAAGLRCPGDISVIGYDATVVGAAADPPLTSIAWAAQSIVPFIVDTILDRTPPAALPDLTVWLVERSSAAPA